MADVSKIGANGIEYDVTDLAAGAEIQDANADISELRSALAADEADIADLQSDMTAAQGNITALQTAVGNMQTVSGVGYCKMADGTLIQWGVATSQSSGNSLTFPSTTAFVTTLPTVIVAPAYNSGVTIRCIFGVADVTLTGCNVYAYDVTTNAMSTAANLAYRWVALGRWK